MASTSRNKGKKLVTKGTPKRLETIVEEPHINLKVKGQHGNEQTFTIKRTTNLKRLMDAYCNRQSENVNAIVFLYDGRRLRGEETPESLKMEDGDEIDAMLHQTGGNLINYA
ncbi:Small ubiquitin-related modifier 1 [Dendrobium catenatum]|uniref:Small ubiquitin-related modifier n=1 Tax=Dendrobium catenatum TaxID=906689 RepID=A0A2I0W7E7_9ASPA|nr:Small ubiquitin-related modifier 1 [Dendrobium catenatum]